MENDMRDSPEGGAPPERGMASGRKATFGIFAMFLGLLGWVRGGGSPRGRGRVDHGLSRHGLDIHCRRHWFGGRGGYSWSDF